jgi:hypothetical protein
MKSSQSGNHPCKQKSFVNYADANAGAQSKTPHRQVGRFGLLEA